MKRIITALLLALVLSCVSPQTQAQPIEKTSAMDLMQFIGSQTGRVVVLNFWASWCQPCIKEMPGLISLRNGFPEAELTVVGLSLDVTAQAAQNFANKNKINFPIFLDGGDVGSTFKVESIPRIMVFDRSGQKAFDHVGFLDSASLRHIVERVQALP